jgi:hypothetical protein
MKGLSSTITGVDGNKVITIKNIIVEKTIKYTDAIIVCFILL